MVIHGFAVYAQVSVSTICPTLGELKNNIDDYKAIASLTIPFLNIVNKENLISYNPYDTNFPIEIRKWFQENGWVIINYQVYCTFAT